MAFEFLDPGNMTDAGMWTWAAALSVVVLVVSWFVAGWWQRRKDRQKSEG